MALWLRNIEAHNLSPVNHALWFAALNRPGTIPLNMRGGCINDTLVVKV
jgi:hypothetical protein